LVAVVAAPILVVLIYMRWPEPLWALIWAASLIAMHEFYVMTLPDAADRRAGLIIGGVAAAALYWLHPKALHFTEHASVIGGSGTAVALLVAVLGTFLYYLFRFRDMATAGTRMSFALTGVIYAGFLPTFVSMCKRDFPGWGADVVVLILLLAWVGDTGAYFAGRFIGGAKLYPAVSPKKTWAGAIGGLAGSVLAAALMKILRLDAVIGWVDVVLLAVPSAVIGQLGDLAESLFKRSVGVKDSGSLLPGHGGILDRIDAVLFIAPYVYLYLTIRVALV